MKGLIAKVKTSFLILLSFSIMLLFSFLLPKPGLVGQWSILNPDGSPSGEYVDFKADSTYSVALPNGQIGEKGNYLLRDSVFSIKNSKDVCGKGYWGNYKLNFYGKDSVHLSLIDDTCSERRMDLVGFNPGLKRRSNK